MTAFVIFLSVIECVAKALGLFALPMDPQKLIIVIESAVISAFRNPKTNAQNPAKFSIFHRDSVSVH